MSCSTPTTTSMTRPGVPVPWQASRVHGITDATVRNAPREGEVVRALREFIGVLPLVAHNASFDVTVLRGAFARQLHATGPSGVL